GSASPVQSSQGDVVSSDAATRAEDGRSRTGLLAMGGVQWQVRRTAVFGQISSTSRNGGFLINKPITMLAGGVRYNFGSSIER
ncbi:MAG: hypothetical protein ACR2M1_17230, partial [Gemmatimonadaceae bacterium]